MSISKQIIAALKRDDISYKCNDNISSHVCEEDIPFIVDEVAEKFQEVLKSLIIDIDNCDNTRDTARRVAKMMVNEIFNGRYVTSPDVKEFPNDAYLDDIYIVGPITIRSTCAHHFQPVVGRLWVGVAPGTNVVGLSKFGRIAEWLASRPTLQETLTTQIADELTKVTGSPNIAVVLRAEHGCVTNRGVKEHQSDMITSVMRGTFRTDPSEKQEFLALLTNSKSYQEV